MVKLPSNQCPRDGERSARTTPRSHHNWGTRFSRRDSIHSEPSSLLQLEALARRTVLLMERFEPRENSFQTAMDLLRLQYNLNFMILCEKCAGLHQDDELLAPER